jgi:glyoxylase I family protein
MRLQRIDHIAIICSDLERSKNFYAEVLGLSVHREEHRVARKSHRVELWLSGEYLIELFTFSASPPRPTDPEALGLRHLAFKVQDLDEAMAHLRLHGLEPEMPLRHDAAGNRCTFVKDPDGLPVEFVEIKPA